MPTATHWDVEKWNRFKSDYNNASSRKEKSFMFEGNEYLVTDAKYLIFYLRKEFLRLNILQEATQ